MRWPRILQQRLRSLLGRKAAERELARELELHLEQLIQQHRASGLDEAAARSAARKEFGSLARSLEECRDARGWRWWEEIAGDVRHAARSLAQAPAFALAAIVTIALGIGVNTAVFSLVHTVLLDPLPFREPGRLVHVASTHPSFPSFQVAAPDLVDWQKQAKSFDQMAGHTFQAINRWTILGDGAPESVQVVQASHQLFAMLGVEPMLGRRFTEEEERKKSPVVVISERLWRSKYAADPKIVGRQIRLIDWPVTVIGVLSRRQAYPEWGDVWMPLCFLESALTESRRFHALEVVARLKPGVSLEQAQAEMTGVARQLAQAYPATNGNIGVAVLPLGAWMTGEVRPALLIAWCAAALVLLLACANVAHLVLVRTLNRSRELAVRAALGAATPRLVRFLLVENLLVAGAGGALGAWLARYALPVLLRWSTTGDIPRLDSAVLSSTALWFGAAATLLCGLIFALPAVLTSRRTSLAEAIKQSSGVALTHRRSRLGPAIVALEVALSFLVMTGAGLLGRSFVALLSEEPGFAAHGVLAVEVPLAIDHAEAEKTWRQRLLPALRALPGVTLVGAANVGPMMLRSTETSRFASRFGIEGRVFDPGALPVAQVRWTAADYFPALQIPLHAGRFFSESDHGKPGVIINQALARRYFPGVDPVGRQLIFGPGTPSEQKHPVLGVVGDVRDLTLEAEPRPTLYSHSVTNTMTVLIRTTAAPAALAPAVRALLHEIRPEAPIRLLEPLNATVASSLALRRFALELLGLFALLAAALTVVGVYGVVNYSLSGRAREFAIRYALGADGAEVRRLVFRHFGVSALAGVLGGAGLLAFSAGAARTQLYKLSPADPLVLTGVTAALAALVLLAAWRPTVRAASVSPAALLRE